MFKDVNRLPVISQSVTDKQTTDKPNSENQKQKTDNKKSNLTAKSKKK